MILTSREYRVRGYNTGARDRIRARLDERTLAIYLSCIKRETAFAVVCSRSLTR